MKLLLDTHIWLWWVNQNTELSDQHQKVIEQADAVFISAISCWELTMLHQRNRIQLPNSPGQWFHHALEKAGIVCLPVSQTVALQSALLPLHHRDPADRFIIATALEHRCKLMSFDQQFELYQEVKPHLLGKRLVND